MYVRRLSLTNFRNYAKQELVLDPAPVLLLGENAQGKTNLLEAVFLLATGRSERASTDADLIAWSVRDDPQPVARVVGEAERRSGAVTVEVGIAGREGANDNLIASKRFKLNGVARRASDVIGAITAVLFTTDDMELVKGAPSGRRRYLDVMLSQAERPYVRALPRYNKLVTQRNALLKRIKEGSARRDELPYWDEEIAREGALIIASRAGAVGEVSESAAAAHGRLSGEREELAVAYQPRFAEGWDAARINASTVDDVAAAFLERLKATHTRDIAAGLTLTGPHRDDLSMTLGGESAASFASRGQQRTAALALRLAEARFLLQRTGEQPVLLLDDVLSELDESRRGSVLDAIEAEQVMITSPDPDRFPPAFVASAQRYSVQNGVAASM
ncbi:MAG TPA: DNA replication/repair protein RecF [Dehalococcoidia bacterium]